MNEDQILGRIAVVEYILSQAFALTLIHFDGSDDVLKDCEEHFTHSFSGQHAEREPETLCPGGIITFLFICASIHTGR